MGVAFCVVGEASQNLFATLQQQSSSGSLGDIWDNVNNTWAAAPSTNNRKVPLTQGTGINAGSFIGGVGQLGTYSGLVVVRIHDGSQGDITVAATQLRISQGDHVYQATTADLSALPLAVWFTINAQGGVLSSNMRGTDNALLSASYVAPNNSGITAAAADALAAKTAAQSASSAATSAAITAASADGKLPSNATTLLNRLDVSVSSRSNHTPADILSHINTQGGVLASNMRGTDNALLAANYTSPNNAGIGTAAADATAARSAAETVSSRLTTTRAGYLDNLSAGPVATQATVAAITNTTRSKMIAPAEVQIPSSGSTGALIALVLYDGAGNLEVPDATPTFTAKNAAGVSRSANLGTVTNTGTGQYEVTYTVASTHAAELVNVTASWAENGQPSVDVATVAMSNTVASGGFNTGDRANLTAIFNKLPTKTYLTGTALNDGDIDLAEMVGDRSPFKADVSALATSAQITALQAFGNANWATATGFLTASDTRLNRLDVNVSSRSTFNPGYTVASSAEIAALQTHGDANWDTAAGFLTANDPRLNHLDAAISSRSSFNPATTGVSLAAGHGLATSVELLAVKAKTDPLPAQPAARTDVPGTAAIAAEVASVLNAAHGTGPWTQSGGDATLAKQDQILAQIASITPTPVSPHSVDDSRTWLLKQTGEGAVAGNLITITTQEVVALAMEFRRKLNPDTTITLVSQVSVLEGDPLSASQLAPSGDRTAAHFTVTTPTAGLRRVQVKVTTSDGQTITGRGYLEVV